MSDQFFLFHHDISTGTTKENNQTKNAFTQPINPNYRRSAQFTGQALGTIDKAAHESSRITPTSASTMHTTSTPI